MALQTIAIPDEISLVINGDITNLEESGLSVLQNSGVQVEWYGSWAADQKIPIEYVLNIAEDQTIPDDAGLKVTEDTSISDDHGLSVNSNGITPDEFSAIQITNQSISADQSLLAKTDALISEESGLGQKSDPLIPAEFGSNISDDSFIPAEWTGSAIVSNDGKSPIEFGENITLLEIIPSENNTATINDSKVLAEFGDSQTGGGATPEDLLETIGRDGTTPEEIGLIIVTDEFTLVENSLVIRHDDLSPAELGLNVNNNQIIRVEWQGQIPLTLDSLIPIEPGSSIAADKATPTESALNISSDTEIFDETSLVVSRLIISNAETGLGVSGDNEIPVEWSGGQATYADAQIPIEWVGLVLITPSSQIPIEYILDITRDGKSVLEFGFSISKSTLIPNEIDTQIAPDSNIPAEFRSTITSDNKILVEYTTEVIQVTSDLSIPIDWFEVVLYPTPRYTRTALGLEYVSDIKPFHYVIDLLALRYVVLAQAPLPGIGMPQLSDFPAIAPNQIQTMAMDFGNFLPPGVTLTGTPDLNISVRSGFDGTPNSRITAGPTIGTAPSTIGGTGKTNTAILFQVSNARNGVVYILEVVCTRTDGDVAEGWNHLPCAGPG